jgi:hypothetical protein
MSKSSVSLKPAESSVASVEELISVLRECDLPFRSAAVVKNLKAAELIGEYDDGTAEEGYTEDSLELAAPTPGRGITYLLLGLGGLESEFDPGITLLKWEGQKAQSNGEAP